MDDSLGVEVVQGTETAPQDGGYLALLETGGGEGGERGEEEREGREGRKGSGEEGREGGREGGRERERERENAMGLRLPNTSVRKKEAWSTRLIFQV